MVQRISLFDQSSVDQRIPRSRFLSVERDQSLFSHWRTGFNTTGHSSSDRLALLVELSCSSVDDSRFVVAQLHSTRSNEENEMNPRREHRFSSRLSLVTV